MTQALWERLGLTQTEKRESAVKRVDNFWTKHVLTDGHRTVEDVLRKKIPSSHSSPIWVPNIHIHLVCPHHYTIALGHADVGYIPTAHIVGFGALVDLARLCTSKVILQEDAGTDIANALVDHLDADAAICRIRATHPCHAIKHRNAGEGVAITLATGGREESCKRLIATLPA